MIDFYTNISRIGNELLIRGITNGEEVRDRLKYSPTLYVEHPNDYGWQTIFGKNVKPIQFDTMREAQDFAESHKGSNLNVMGFPYFHFQHCLEDYNDTVDRWRKEDIRIFNIDIEVTSTEGFPEARDAAYPVTAICIHDSKIDKFVTFGHGQWSAEKSELPKEISDKVRYVACSDERDLLNKFLRYWDMFTPNIVTGWNVEMFDMPYLYNRLENLGMGGRKLSPWKKASVREIPTKHGHEQVCKIVGVDQIDYLDRYRKNKIQESYRLDFIAEVELGERKLDYSEVQGLHNLYFDNFQKFIDYNIQDVNLVKRLDEKMGLIDAQIMIAYEACINFEDVSSPVRVWDCLINKELYNNRKVPNWSLSTVADHQSIPGGFVKTPQVGKHGWCMSFDLNSLYPHLIMQFNISPETFVEGWQLWPHDAEETRVQRLLATEKLGNVPANASITGSGFAYSNEFEGIIPRLMSKMYQDRKKYKKEMLRKQKAGENDSVENLRQYVLKILLNSGYGALVNKYFRWYDRRMGASITLSGQLVIQIAEREINKWMNKVLQTNNVDYIIAIDTDSNYVNMQPLVEKMFPHKSKEELIDILDKIGEEQIQKILDQGFEETKEYLNAFSQKMVMEREAIASSAFWTAKKRYAMCVWDMEGVRMPADKPKLKIQGLEAIRSSTPQSCRGALLDMIKLTLLEDEETVQNFIAEFKEKYKKMPPEEIAFPRTMNNVSKMTLREGFMKGTPPHVRGAIQFNRMLKRHGLEKEWEEIKNGEKGKFIYLLQPNNIGTDVISFSTSIPEVFACSQYIDVEKMFEKTITDPMTMILDPIGWSCEQRASLESFFS